MAEALVRTIPCDRCNTSFNLDDWSEHMRTCSNNENRQTRGEKRTSLDDESNIERIPCEFCDALVNLDDWDTHTRICRQAYQRRIEDLRRGVESEPIDALIPCEICNVPISVHELERHTSQCGASSKRANTRLSTDEPTLIPCEKCNTTVNAQEWERHMRQCGNNYRRNIENSENDETTLIPCEYCNVPISVHELEWHTRQCSTSGKRAITRLSTFKDEPVLIPCENCNTTVNAQEWERHTRQCGNNYRRNIENSQSEEAALIPCEYCNIPVSIHELEMHTNACAQADTGPIGKIARILPTKRLDATVPCENCNQAISTRRYNAHTRKCRQQQTASAIQMDTTSDQVFENNFNLPEHWDGAPSKNLTRFKLETGSDEYQFVAGNFRTTLPSNQIIQIERIQNRRWYRQYDAHKEDFIERYGKSTEQWLFHGIRKSESAEAIIRDCFNRSHAVNCAVGQGIYFATQAVVSNGYTQPNAKGYRHMFMARVLVGKTTAGNPSMRVCPPGFDTTGGENVFVTYHDAQAYGQYLIVYK